MKFHLRRFIAALLVVTTSAFAWPHWASAGTIATDTLVAGYDRDRVAAALGRADVRAQLEALGVQPADVQTRLDALTDDEVARLAQRLDSLPAGGDGVIGAILLVFLVLLLTDIMGVTKVFPFTRSVR